MRLGLEHFRSAEAHWLLPLLVQPFVGAASEESERERDVRSGLVGGIGMLGLLSRRR